MKGSASAPSLGKRATFEGMWKGGPHDGVVMTFELQSITELRVTYKAPSGKLVEWMGRVQSGGMSARCFWTDPDIFGAGSKAIEQTVDLRLDITGSSWAATAQMADGTPMEWKAKRVVRKGRQGRRLSTRGRYHNKEVFERLTAPKNRTKWTVTARDEVLGKSLKAGQTQRNGMLGETAPLCLGDPFNDNVAGVRPQPRLGRSMLTAPPRKGRIGSTFSEPTPLAVGDPYLDPGRVIFKKKQQAHKEAMLKGGYSERRGFRVGQAKDLQKPRPFLSIVDSSISKKALLEQAKKARAAGAKPPRPASAQHSVPIGPKNFYTNPPKKGGFGVPGVLLTEKTAEMKRMIRYVEDPYEAGKEQKTKEAAAKLSAIGDRPAFSSRVKLPHGGKFTEDKELYHGLGPGGHPRLSFRGSPSKRPASAPARRRQRQAGEEVSEELPPYRPPFKQTPDGTFSRFPVHIPNPMPETMYGARHKTDKKWTPPTIAKSIPVTSVLKNPRNIAGLRK